jgi:oligopeptidase B
LLENSLNRKQDDQDHVVFCKEDLLTHPVIKNNRDLIEFFKESSFLVQNLQFSHDHRFVAGTFNTHESNVLIVKDMNEGMTGFVAFDVDPFTVFDHLYGLFYVERDPDTGKGRKIWRQDFLKTKSEEEKILEQTRVQITGKSASDSELIFEESDRSYSCEVSQSLSGEYVFLKSDNLSYDPQHIATEFRFRASNRDKGEFLVIQSRKEGTCYDVKHQGGNFYMLVSSVSEVNGKILKLEIPPYQAYTPPSEELVESSSKELQVDFMGAKVHTPHSPGVYIEHVEAFKDHLVSILTDTETSLQHIQVDTFSTGSTDIVSYDKYEGSLKVANSKSYRLKLDSSVQDYLSNNFAYILSTLHAPDQLIRYDLDTRVNKLITHSFEVPGIHIQDYSSERIVLPANDGTKIPLTLVYNKKEVKTGKQAAGIIDSYGGDIENSHNFQLNYSWYSLLDRGFLYIIPHIRGSFDVNRSWYDQGVAMNKIRHLQDLLDVIVSLFSEKIVSSASGYSTCPSGGLALASLLLKEPDLLSCAVLRVPFI